MDRKCDACGNEVKGGYSIGGTLLCRRCEPDVMSEIKAARTEGRVVNAMGIARKLFRSRNSTQDYLLRDIPEVMMRKMKERALKESGSVRDVILAAVTCYLANK